jgi:hypothetical protein
MVCVSMNLLEVGAGKTRAAERAESVNDQAG